MPIFVMSLLSKFADGRSEAAPKVVYTGSTKECDEPSAKRSCLRHFDLMAAQVLKVGAVSRMQATKLSGSCVRKETPGASTIPSCLIKIPCGATKGFHVQLRFSRRLSIGS